MTHYLNPTKPELENQQDKPFESKTRIPSQDLPIKEGPP